MAAQKHPMPQFMNTKRLSTGPLSQRQIASKFGISRSAQWRAKKIADIPEEEFEALIESDNPPTVTTLVEYAHGLAPRLRARATGDAPRIGHPDSRLDCRA
jgi:hypothetical protein